MTKKFSKRQGGIVGFIFFMVIVTIFASGAIAMYVIFIKPESKSKVPQFVGSSVSEAVADAERLGLVVQVEPVASTMPEGRVLAQAPLEGAALRKGQVVVLQVSRGGELHAVPDVKGKTLSQAQSEIKSSGFSLGDVIKISEPNITAGTVIAQSPSAPANVGTGRKIDLLVQDGASSSEKISVPDVNRMTESEARNIIETSGLKVQSVERVYSPLLPEGLAIETRPSAGSILNSGQGVVLKLASQRRPAGFMDANSDSNSNVRRVTTQPDKVISQPQKSQPEPQKTDVKVSVGGEDDVFIGDDYETKTSTGGGNKTAKIRYIVPPIARPMDLRIEITDPSGKRNVLSKQVRSGESINTTAKYSQECVISIYLGGEFVWQERQR